MTASAGTVPPGGTARRATPGHLRVVGATANRVLRQLHHDPRTIGLLLGAPLLLTGLLAWILSDQPGVFDRWGGIILAVFPLIVMFLVTSVATLRERTGGTLERLMTMPLAKVDFIAGYAVAFGVAATVQAVVVAGVSLTLFGLDVSGPVWGLVLVAVLDALLGTALGLFVSAFARTEFQAVQFFPMILLPQLLLCGILGPRSTLPPFLHAVSNVLPLTYAIEAMQHVVLEPSVGASFWRDSAVVAGFIAAALVAGSLTLRRRTP